MKEVTIKTIGWTTFGIAFCIMFYGMSMIMSLSNANIKTEHTINFNADNETKEALQYLAEIKEHEVKQDNLFCENQLLNQSKWYEIQLMQQEIYWKSYCRFEDGTFRLSCWE